MDFGKAMKMMKEEGKRVKRPGWGGYWFWDDTGNTVTIKTKDGDVFSVKKSPDMLLTISNMLEDDWEEATMYHDFADAIRAVKAGKKIKRAGWNGKNQYVALATHISFQESDGKAVVNPEHKDIGNKALAFFGTSGVQIGWLASQADMLAEDWIIMEE